MTQLRGWEPVKKPWEPSAIAKAAMVRARTSDGRDVTLLRAAIVEEEGRTDLVGRAREPQRDADEAVTLDLATVVQLDMRRIGPANLSLSRGQVTVLLTLALVVILFG